jgi:hypothetical protein
MPVRRFGSAPVVRESGQGIDHYLVVLEGPASAWSIL